MKQTENYELKKPELADLITASIQALNANADDMDKQLTIIVDALESVRRRLWEMSTNDNNSGLTVSYENGWLSLMNADVLLCNIYIGYSDADIDRKFDAERVITDESIIGSGAISVIAFNLLKDTFCESGFPVHFDSSIHTSELESIYTQCNNFMHSKLVNGPYGEMLENFMNSFREWIWYTIQNNPDPGNIKLISDEQFGDMFKYALLGISENQPGYEGSVQVFEELIERMIIPKVIENFPFEETVKTMVYNILGENGLM